MSKLIITTLLLLSTEDRVLKEIQEPAKKGIILCQATEFWVFEINH